MAVAFGQIRISPEVFWEMTPREFFNAWRGFNDTLAIKRAELEAHRSMAYGAARWNAAATAMSSEAAKKISQHRFDWERPVKKKHMTYTDIASSLKSLNKARKN